ncbi:hypothetical protein [Pseudoalteromonas peptidolytica]|nr:hypothetical protein [Pseudoalteromonas peptidolytica]MDW7548943.1 hypothetical protein [Pseudoalteromonas peptidolytica]
MLSSPTQTPTIKINELCQLKTLNQTEREAQIFVVNLLDSVSVQFAPHEQMAQDVD